MSYRELWQPEIPHIVRAAEHKAAQPRNLVKPHPTHAGSIAGLREEVEELIEAIETGRPIGEVMLEGGDVLNSVGIAIAMYRQRGRIRDGKPLPPDAP